MHTYSQGWWNENEKRDGATILLPAHILGYFLEQSLNIECLFKLAFCDISSPSLENEEERIFGKAVSAHKATNFRGQDDVDNIHRYCVFYLHRLIY